jgi:uncharacterized membrane protein HdeD (DUF308 family)
MLSGPLKKRIAGMLLMALGVGALSAPLTVGRWSLAALGIPLMVLSVAEAYAAFRSPQHDKIGAYLPSVLALLAGNLLILSSALVLSGLQVVLVAILVIDGLSKILTVRSRPPSECVPTIVSGLVDFACAALLWYLGRIIGAELAVGVVIGAYISAAGWRMLMAPAEAAAPDTTAGAPTVHPDPGLGLPPNETFAQLHAEIDSAAHTVRATDHVDVDARGRVSRHPRWPDADVGHLAWRQFAVRCNRRRCPDDLCVRDALRTPLASAVETVYQACRAIGLVAPSRLEKRNRTVKSGG